jgi:RNA-directed DNA polymerase
MRITEDNLTGFEQTGYGMLEQILSPANLNAAYKRVLRNKGADGNDEMQVGFLEDYLVKEKDALIASILDGKCHLNPIHRLEIRKENGKKR